MNFVEEQKKFEVGNSDFDNKVELEQLMKKEIIQMGQPIKESFVKEMKDNNKIMEEKHGLSTVSLVDTGDTETRHRTEPHLL